MPWTLAELGVTQWWMLLSCRQRATHKHKQRDTRFSTRVQATIINCRQTCLATH